jgi:transcription elongation factor Elf1
MADDSYLDKKYFIDSDVYNCPFCNRRNVKYHIFLRTSFNWSEDKTCYVYFVICNSCSKSSMHLSYENIVHQIGSSFYFIEDVDRKIFYSVPTSFFVLDNRINKILRELISEAEGCLKMNFLTGASACMRKAIYELMVIEKCSKPHYEEKIKELKSKYKNTDPTLFDILGHIQDMTSNKIHEQSWDKWDSNNLTLIIETLKTVLYDIYVIPAIKKQRSAEIKQLKERVEGHKNKKNSTEPKSDNN